MNWDKAKERIKREILKALVGPPLEGGDPQVVGPDNASLEINQNGTWQVSSNGILYKGRVEIVVTSAAKEPTEEE